jgi:putative phosphoesterase
VNRSSSSNARNAQIVVGVISDTHGLIRPEALAALQGVDRIIHAGDIGKAEVLDVLKTIAPLVTIKGNNDRGSWAESLPETRSLRIGTVRLFIVHDVKDLSFDPAARGYHAVISGHSHKPSVVERGGVLFVNPGSAGPRRFKLPIAVAKLVVDGADVKARIIELTI